MDPDPASAITARDPLVVDLRDLQRDHRVRDARGLVIVDEEALLVAALAAGCAVEVLLEDAARSIEPAPWRAMLGATVSVPAGQEALRALGGSGRIPRIVAAIRRHPEPPATQGDGGLALLGVSDAGNVGGILRTASAFGLPAVTLLDGCADPWGRKALRVAQGAQFAPGLVRSAGSVDALTANRERPLVAHVPQGGIPPHELPPGSTVLLSSAHGGLDHADLARCAATVTVPGMRHEGALGVSAVAAILAYAMAMAGAVGRPAPAADEAPVSARS